MQREGNNMAKRALTIVLALLMISALFVGCAGDQTSGDDTTTTASTPDTPAPDTGNDTTPQETTPAPKDTTTEKETTKKETTTEAPAPVYPTIPEGTMVYYEDFTYDNVSGNEVLEQLLGWKIMNKSDGGLTDNTAEYAIEDGQLKVTNWDDGRITGADCYFVIADTEYMAAACQGDYTVQYDVLCTATKAHDRYINIITNYDGYNTYNSFHLRMNGSGNNQPRFFGTWYVFDLKGSDYYATGKDDGTSGSSIIYKLTNGQTTFVSGETPLIGKSLTIRIQSSYNDGPTIWVRDNSQANAEFICVSKPDESTTGYAFWNATEDYAVALKVGGSIDGYIDNIAIWTGLGDMPVDTTTAAYENAIK